MHVLTITKLIGIGLIGSYASLWSFVATYGGGMENTWPAGSDVNEWQIALEQRGLELGSRVIASSSGVVIVERGKRSQWKRLDEGNLNPEKSSDLFDTACRLFQSFRLKNATAEGNDAIIVLSMKSRSRLIQIEWNRDDSKKMGVYAPLRELIKLLQPAVSDTDITSFLSSG